MLVELDFAQVRGNNIIEKKLNVRLRKLGHERNEPRAVISVIGKFGNINNHNH